MHDVSRLAPPAAQASAKRGAAERPSQPGLFAHALELLCDPSGVEGFGDRFPGVFDPRLPSVTPSGVGPAQATRRGLFAFDVSNPGQEETSTGETPVLPPPDRFSTDPEGASQQR
jgi:hypothetical protein